MNDQVASRLAKMLRGLVVVRCPVHRMQICDRLDAIEQGEHQLLVAVTKSQKLMLRPGQTGVTVWLEVGDQCKLISENHSLPKLIGELRQSFNLRWLI